MNTKYIINYNNKLGAGTFSSVYSASDVSGNIYAVKIIEKNNKYKISKMTNSEISILNLLKSKHIVNLLDFMETETKYFLYLEYVELKFTNVIQHILFSEIFVYLKQLLSALIYIQSLNIVHNEYHGVSSYRTKIEYFNDSIDTKILHEKNKKYFLKKWGFDDQ